MPLACAAEQGQLECVGILLDAGAQINCGAAVRNFAFIFELKFDRAEVAL